MTVLIWLAVVAATAHPHEPQSHGQPARARANLASYISHSDYPRTALANREQGTVHFVLTVGPNGRVGDCRVTQSSGSAALDSATCRIMRARARFTPARDAAGHPTADTIESSIGWHLQ